MASNDSRDASRSPSSPSRNVQLRQSPLPRRVVSPHSRHLTGVPITLATESVRPNAFIFCYEWTLIEVERVVSNALDSGPGVIGLGTSRSTLIHPCSCVARLPPQFPPQASRTDNEFPLPRLLDFRQFARLPRRSASDNGDANCGAVSSPLPLLFPES